MNPQPSSLFHPPEQKVQLHITLDDYGAETPVSGGGDAFSVTKRNRPLLANASAHHSRNYPITIPLMGILNYLAPLFTPFIYHYHLPLPHPNPIQTHPFLGIRHSWCVNSIFKKVKHHKHSSRCCALCLDVERGNLHYTVHRDENDCPALFVIVFITHIHTHSYACLRDG